VPFRTVVFHSPLAPVIAQQRLRGLIRPRQGFLDSWEGDHGDGDAPFQGEEVDGVFKFMRVITGRNSFLPIIVARLEADSSGGSVITLRMRLHAFVVVFMIVWFGILATVAIEMPPVRADANSWVPIGMLVFGTVMVLAGFYPEARKAENLLRTALQAPPP